MGIGLALCLMGIGMAPRGSPRIEIYFSCLFNIHPNPFILTPSLCGGLRLTCRGVTMESLRGA
jgi:hypothetical protein